MIYIYHDDGASPRSVLACRHAIARYTPYAVSTLDATSLLQGAWVENAKAFLVPGGADIPYGQKLNGPGNSLIKQYIQQGGTYIGICAGAYYASAYCDFHRGDAQEVLGARELAFYQGAAVGPTLADYDEKSEKGMRQAQIRWEDGSLYQAYFNGGCYFPQACTTPYTKVLGFYVNDPRRIPTYGDEPLPAVLQCSVGEGQAILSGVHPEYVPDNGENILFKKILELLTAQP